VGVTPPPHAVVLVGGGHLASFLGAAACRATARGVAEHTLPPLHALPSRCMQAAHAACWLGALRPADPLLPVMLRGVLGGG
jgi:hypothetical protein